MKKFLLSLFCAFVMFSQSHAATVNNDNDEDCYPPIDVTFPQYIVDYGSLIQTDSKQHTTYPNISTNIPVLIMGYDRGWFAKGSSNGVDSISLGVAKDPSAHFSSVIFNLSPPEAMVQYDESEKSYCRVAVPRENIETAGQQSIPVDGQYWIYVTKPSAMTKPSAKYPIMQSYVDIFLSGCLEIQKKYSLDNFATGCIDTTRGWSEHWVNDRKPSFATQPEATKIDKLLASRLSGIVKKVRVN